MRAASYTCGAGRSNDLTRLYLEALEFVSGVEVEVEPSESLLEAGANADSDQPCRTHMRASESLKLSEGFSGLRGVLDGQASTAVGFEVIL
ncbi:hypothetical protein CC2G_001543 [Coprinopsis cinerea AmutBmut pab1-1]|nr:hypothetical protein CC2G_001543 [Coprinopsis cinerea AmutBmut pab1-1]